MAKVKLGKKARADKTIHLDEIYKLKGQPEPPTKFRLVSESGAGTISKRWRLFLDDGREITGLVAFAAYGATKDEPGFVTLTFSRDQFISEVMP